MKKVFQKFTLATIVSMASLLVARAAQAVCPVCTVAVVAGVGIAEMLGIDDMITGIWIGGLVVSLSLWTIDWLNRKNIKFYLRKISVFAMYYLLSIWPLAERIFGPNCHKIWGYSKLMLGIVLGTIGFAVGVWLDSWMRKKNNNEVYFYFQKVIMPISMLTALSLAAYFLTKC